MRDESRTNLSAAVERLRARALLVAFTRSFLRVLFYALCVAAIVLFFAPKTSLVALAVASLALALVVALALAFARRPDARAAAKRFDDVAALKDRVSSAIDLADVKGPMVDALIDDAVSHSRAIEPARVYPLAAPREGWLLPIPLALAALALLLPTWMSADAAPNAEVAASVGNGIKELKEYVAKQKEQDLSPERKQLLGELEKIASELSKDNLQKKDALAQIAAMQQELEKQKEDLEKQKLELEQRIKNAKRNEETKKLAEEMNRGNYSDAAAKLAEMMDALQKKIAKLKEQKADKKDIEEAEKELEELREIKAKLAKLMNVQYDIGEVKKVLEFLDALEGELGALPDEKIVDARFLKLGQCKNPGKPKFIVKLHDRLISKENKAGKATMDNFFGEEKRENAKTEEHKVTVHEGKGSSSFTQTQVANDGSRSRLNEREVLAAEKRAAEDTIQRQEIPAGYREYIRRYFDRLQPDRAAADGTSEEAPSSGAPATKEK